MKVYRVSITLWVSFEWRRNTLKGLAVTGPEDTSGMSRKHNRDAKGAQKTHVKVEVQEWESRRVC